MYIILWYSILERKNYISNENERIVHLINRWLYAKKKLLHLAIKLTHDKVFNNFFLALVIISVLLKINEAESEKKWKKLHKLSMILFSSKKTFRCHPIVIISFTITRRKQKVKKYKIFQFLCRIKPSFIYSM